MAFKPENYAAHWKQFSEYIRFERAKNKCERCNAPNNHYKYLSNHLSGGFQIVSPDDDAGLHEVENWLLDLPFRKSKIVLTVAHLDYEGGICDCKKIYGFKCAKPSHVLALCQSCHLSMDRPHHLKVQAENRKEKKDAARGLLEFV